MSEARDKYYIWKDEIDIPLCVDEYVSQLESEKAELISIIKAMAELIDKFELYNELSFEILYQHIENALRKHGVTL